MGKSEPADHYSGEGDGESLWEALFPGWPLSSRLCFKTENNNTLWTRLLKIEPVASVAVGGEVLESGAQASWMRFNTGHWLLLWRLSVLSVVLGKLCVSGRRASVFRSMKSFPPWFTERTQSTPNSYTHQCKFFPVHLRGSKIIDFYQRISDLGTPFVTYILHFFSKFCTLFSKTQSFHCCSQSSRNVLLVERKHKGSLM